MRRGSLVTAILLVVGPLASNADPVEWHLFPNSQTVTVGQPFQLHLVVTCLGNGVPPTLEGFDVDITFSGVFTTDPNTVVFGNFLGDPNDPSETQTTSAVIGTEVLFLAEQSLLADPALDALQGSSFTLASITFTPNATGTYLISGDDFAGGLFLTDGSSLGPGVNSATVEVLPEPGTSVVLVLGLAGLGLSRRSRRA
ncbi:MAG: PEP-CTERM sorting domain-containing protein [Planctomycetota bacterium]|jgi:hypothetical protein